MVCGVWCVVCGVNASKCSSNCKKYYFTIATFWTVLKRAVLQKYDFELSPPHFSFVILLTPQVAHELVETPLKNPSGHGVMVVVRIASEKLGRLAFER